MAIKRSRKLLNILLLLIAAGFIMLTVLVHLDPIPKIDREASEEIQEHNNPTLDVIMRAISWPGYMPNSLIIAAAVSLSFLAFRFRREALFVVLTLLSGLVSTLVKILINRPRPLPDMVRVIEKTRQQSFPSGHVLFYVVFFGFITLLMWHLKEINRVFRVGVSTICLCLIFTVPLSRIYLGAHWFSDVNAGFLLGLLCLYLLSYVYFKKALNDQPAKKGG